MVKGSSTSGLNLRRGKTQCSYVSKECFSKKRLEGLTIPRGGSASSKPHQKMAKHENGGELYAPCSPDWLRICFWCYRCRTSGLKLFSVCTPQRNRMGKIIKLRKSQRNWQTNFSVLGLSLETLLNRSHRYQAKNQGVLLIWVMYVWVKHSQANKPSVPRTGLWIFMTLAEWNLQWLNESAMGERTGREPS
jgi:hypothetical protein